MGQANLGNRGTLLNGAPGASGFGGLSHRVRAVTVTFLAVGAATLAIGISAASATTWNLPATEISAAGEAAEQPQIAIAPDGTTTVVWRRLADGIIQAATRPTGSNTFGAVQDLSDAELFSSGPQVAVAPDGETTVVWGQIVGASGFTIQARTRPAGSSTFGAIQNLATNQGSGVSGSPRVAVARDGKTTVTWVDGSNTVKAVTRPAGSSTFGAVVPLSGVGENAANPGVAVAPDGTTTVVWNLTSACSPGPTCYVVQARTRPAGSSTFGAIQDASPTSEGALAPNLAVSADGATTVVWTLTRNCLPSPCEYTAQATNRPGGSTTFGPVQDVSPTDTSSGFTNVAVAPDGAITVVWGQLIGGTLTIRARTRPAGSSTFGAIEDISEIGNQSAIQVAAAPDGAITVAWEWEDGVGAHTVQAASRPAGASAFGAVTNLSAAGATPPSSRLAVALNGAVTAVWEQDVGGFSGIQTASTDPTTYSLAVQLTGEGEGSVASSPSGIECGSTCEALFDLGTKVTLTATAASGSTFTGWSGAGCSGTGSCVVAMSEARSVTATFSGKKPKLSLSLGGPKKVRAGSAFRVGIRVTNRGSKKPTPVGGRATKAESLKTCLKVPRNLFVNRVQKGAKTRGRTICWTRASLGTSKWVSYKVSLRSSSYFGGSEALRASATANGESGTTANASRALKIRVVDPRPAPKPFPPTD